MKQVAALSLAFLLAGCLPALQEEQITVSAEGKIEVEPDSVRQSVFFRSREASSDAAIREISSSLDQFRNEMPQLEGLKAISIETSDIDLKPVRDAECLRLRYNNDICPVTGYIAELEVSVEASPATIAGNLLSFSSELGAEEIMLEEYFYSDTEALKEAAQKAAYENARRKALQLAEAAKVTLGKPVRISANYRGRGIFIEGFVQKAPETIVLTGQRVTRASLALPVSPIEVESSVSVVFEIE